MNTIIKFLLSRLAGITARQWATALHWVTMAARDAMLKTGSNRREAVSKMILSLWPDMKAWALNLLIETAVAYQRYQK
jgi:hypothetical protein